MSVSVNIIDFMQINYAKSEIRMDLHITAHSVGLSVGEGKLLYLHAAQYNGIFLCR